MFIELNRMITFLFYFQETYNNRLRERYGDDPSTHPEFDPDLWVEARSSGGLDKNRVYRLSNTTAANCGRSVLLQPSGALNQYRAPNLKSSWPCSKRVTTYQKRTHNLKNSKEWRPNNTEQSLNNKERPMKSFVKWSGTWHKVEHVCLILFGRLTPSLLLLLLLHLYINF